MMQNYEKYNSKTRWLETATPLASPTATFTTNVATLDLFSGLRADHPLGLTLVGIGVNTQGGLTANMQNIGYKYNLLIISLISYYRIMIVSWRQ